MQKLNNRIFTVSEITQAIKGLLEDAVGEVWVEGEISNFCLGPNGHFYFSLKDQNAIIKAAMFVYANKALKFKPENGLKVICFGKISVYAPHGQYQIIVEKLEPKGVGARQLAFEQLKNRLEKEGLFELARKRQLPRMPFCVGIVTSVKGAAVRDILQILKKGAPLVDVVLRDVRVQGETAAADIANGIKDLNEYSNLDLIIVSRGGGSIEDLWSFNEEIVARAIYNSKLPVISAVGHQINTTLSDLVADVFVETPSAAAKLIVDKKNTLIAELADFSHRIKFSVSEKLGDLKNQLTALVHMLKSPYERLLERQQQTDELLAGLNNHMRNNLYFAKERFNSLAQRLDVLSPLAILSRGYSLSMLLPSEGIVKDSHKLKSGDRIKTILHNGSFISLVEEICENERKDDI